LPKGHSSCVLWEKETGDREQKSVGIAFTGGARHKEPSTWELGNSITLVEFAVSEDDIDITSCCVFGPDKCGRSSLFPLQGSTMLAKPEKNTPDQEDHKFKFLLQHT